ncbi:MAG: T9SS type A sorting domain-containing protein, partial [Bacteroidota bacterium]
GLNALEVVNGELFVGGPNLRSLSGLDALRYVRLRFLITDNPALVNLEGLGSLEEVGRTLEIVRNSALESLRGLPTEPFTVNTGIVIRVNRNLSSLEGLEGLTSPGFVRIETNANLTSLQGLSGFTGTNGSFSLVNNDALTTLDGLPERPFSIGGTLLIQGNEVLTNLDGLIPLTTVGAVFPDSRLEVENNPLLSSCCSLFGALTTSSTLAAVEIQGNAPGCNAPEDITSGEACVVAGEEGTPLVFGLAPCFPNPTTDAATLRFTLDRPAEVRLSVYDALGRTVAVLVNDRQAAGTHEVALDAAALPSGVYVVRLTADNEVATRRVSVVR